MDILNFYKGKSVLVTGHTGFKGAWLCKMLTLAGAKVTGYALNPPTFPSLFEIAEIKQDITSIIGDIRDISSLKKVFEFVQKIRKITRINCRSARSRCLHHRQ